MRYNLFYTYLIGDVIMKNIDWLSMKVIGLGGLITIVATELVVVAAWYVIFGGMYER